jgi:hypothetical protein
MSKKASRTPDFIGVGAPRTGTTWLFTMLKSHPEIELPSQKAVNYFNDNYSNGKEWYYDHFTQYREKIVGEISPLYFGNDQLGKRIQETAPNAKIILICRDPLERLLSHVRLINTLSGQEMGLDQRIRRSPHLIEQGLYFKHISKLLESIEVEKLLVISFGEISESPSVVYKRVVQFLGADSSFIPKQLSDKVGFNITPKFKKLESLRIGLHRLLINNGLSKLLWFFKKAGFAKFLRKLNDNSKSQALDLKDAPADMSRFDDIYKEDTHRLEVKFNIKIRND